MNRTAQVALLLLALPLAVQAQRPAVQSFRAGTLLLTGELGGAAFTDFRRAQAQLASSTGELTEFQRRISARTAATFGARMAYWITNGLALRVGAAYAPTTFTVANDEAVEQMLDDGTGIAPTYASLDIWTLDGAMVFRFPRVFGRVVPYGILGGGAVRYERGNDAELPPEAYQTFATGKHTTAAALFGLGAALPMQRHNLLLSFELTNHLSRSPLAEAVVGESFTVSGLGMQIDEEEQQDGRLTSNIRLVVGFTLPVRLLKER